MMAWSERSLEERAHLNPALCSILIWRCADAYHRAEDSHVRLDLVFLLLPLVLDRRTRDALPGNVKTSLPVWINNHPLLPLRVAERARALVSYSREALIFGGSYGLIEIELGSVKAAPEWKAKVSRALKESSEEVRTCAKKAEFIGRWFAKAGTPDTVMALIGVRP